MLTKIRYTLQSILAFVGIVMACALSDKSLAVGIVIGAASFYLLLDIAAQLDKIRAFGMTVKKPVTMYYKLNKK